MLARTIRAPSSASVARRHRLDRRFGAHGHEARRLDLAVRRREARDPRRARRAPPRRRRNPCAASWRRSPRRQHRVAEAVEAVALAHGMLVQAPRLSPRRRRPSPAPAGWCAAGGSWSPGRRRRGIAARRDEETRLAAIDGRRRERPRPPPARCARDARGCAQRWCPRPRRGGPGRAPPRRRAHDGRVDLVRLAVEPLRGQRAPPPAA